jgi:hypothetical protein
MNDAMLFFPTHVGQPPWAVRRAKLDSLFGQNVSSYYIAAGPNFRRDVVNCS